MIILYALGLAVLIAAFLAIREYSLLKKSNKESDDLAAEIEHRYLVETRRANMTQAQRDSEDDYINGLRNVPENERFKQTTGNSLSKDLLGFDLLPK